MRRIFMQYMFSLLQRKHILHENTPHTISFYTLFIYFLLSAIASYAQNNISRSLSTHKTIYSYLKILYCLHTKAFSALRFSDHIPFCTTCSYLHILLCAQNNIFLSPLRSFYRHLLIYSCNTIAHYLHYITSAIKSLSYMLQSFRHFSS
jgi:hypothetical protein